jgi:hypothetical protein
MREQTVRKTYKYKLKPTPVQERALAFVLRAVVNSITQPSQSAKRRGKNVV